MSEMMVTEKSNRDVTLVGIMFITALLFWLFLSTHFTVADLWWFKVVFVLSVSPMGGLILHARPTSQKLAVWLFFVTAVAAIDLL